MTEKTQWFGIGIELYEKYFNIAKERIDNNVLVRNASWIRIYTLWDRM